MPRLAAEHPFFFLDASPCFFQRRRSAAHVRRCVCPRRGRGLTEGVTACAVGAGAHLRSAYRWMADDVDAQSDDDGGRWRMATADGGEVAYLRHAEVGVEENPGTLRCALHTGLRKSAVALRRESANRGMWFLQPLFGGSCECIDVTW